MDLFRSAAVLSLQNVCLMCVPVSGHNFGDGCIIEMCVCVCIFVLCVCIIIVRLHCV